MRAYALIPVNDIGTLEVDFCLGAEATSGGVRWGMWIVAGTRAQLAALDADPDVVAICAFWQRENTISAGKRNEVDTWAAEWFPSLPSVPIDWTYQQVVDELYSRANEHYTSGGLFLRPGGMTTEPASIRALAVSPPPEDLNLGYVGYAWELIDIGDYGLWELYAHQDELVRVHNALWEVEPSGTFGLLGAVDEYGTSFYAYAVMDTFDHPASELIARRDRIVTYLEGLSYSNTDALRAATTEHAQISGIVTALGYSMPVLWNVMHGG